MKTDIKQLLSRNIYGGLINANQPSSTNPFLTAADADAGGTTGNYGAFYDTTDQVFVAATATPVTLNTTYLFDGITIGAPTSRIVMANYGIYNVQFSAQLLNSDAGAHTVTFWLRKNGVDIPASAKDVVVPVGIYTADWGWLVECNATDYVEIIFLTPNVLVTLDFTAAAPPKPIIPSMLVVVTQGSKGVVGEIEEAEYKFFGAAPQSIASGGVNPQTLTLSNITYPVKASVTDGRSRRIVYNIIVSKTTTPASTLKADLYIGGLTLPITLASTPGDYANNNYVCTIYMNFRAPNNIEAIATIERHIPTGAVEEVNSIRGYGTWDKSITNFIKLDFSRISGNAGYVFEVKQITSELI